MIDLKAKWKALLLTVSCFFVCLGVGVATVDKPLATNVTANAEDSITTYSVGMLAVDGGNANGIYLKRADGQAFAATDGTWTEKLTFEAGSGTGAKLNDATLTDMAIPSTIYVGVGTANPGDVFTIAGAFYNTNLNAKYVVTESKFMWTGSSWVGYAETYTDAQLAGYDTVTIHRLGLGTEKVIDGVFDGAGLTYQKDGNNSSTGVKFRFGYNSADTSAGKLSFRLRGGAWEGFEFRIIDSTLMDVNGDWLSVPLANNVNYNIELGAIDTKDGANVWVYIKINGVLVTTKTVAKASYSAFTTRSISIYADPGTKATLSVGYETQNIGELELHGNSKPTGGAGTANNVLYLQRKDGKALPVQNWDYLFTADSASNFKVNRENATLAEMKSTPAGLYLAFNGVNAGDVVSISGNFTGVDYGAKYVIKESFFKWTGSNWEKDYLTHELGAMSFKQVHSESQTNMAYFKSGDEREFISASTDENVLWESPFTLVPGSGEGVTLNGQSGHVIKFPNTIFVELNKAPAVNDLLVIDGTFINETLGIKYDIEKSTFQWNGSKWVEYISPESYDQRNLGKMELAANLSSTAGANATNSFVYLTWNLEKYGSMPTGWDVWNNLFELGGAHVYVNDGNENKIAKAVVSNEWLFIEFAGVNKGDKITIGGTLVYNSNPLKLVLDDVSFVWNGSVWAPYVEYTTHNVSALSIHAYSMAGSEHANNTTLWLSGTGLNSDSWLEYTLVSGTGVTLNGNPATVKVQDFTNGLYLAFGAVNKGAVLTISGTYACAGTAIKYNISEMSFQWTGAGWINYFEDSQLAAYDVVNIIDIGWGLEKTIKATEAIDNTGLSYTPSAANTTGSVKFRFAFNSTDTASGATEIRLRGTAWQGIRFIIGAGHLQSNYSNTTTAYALKSNTDYEIELGAIDLNNGTAIWIYAEVNGVIVISDVVLKTAENPKEPSGEEPPVYPTFATFNTNHISFYFTQGVKAKFTDADHIQVTYNYLYNTETVTIVDYAKKNSEYNLFEGKSYNTFVGWVANNTLYPAGAEFTTAEDDVTFTALQINFEMKDGAAIRIAGTAETSGIRFTTLLKETDLNTLLGYGVTVSYGTLIMPYDYLGAGEAPNLDGSFAVGSKIVKIPSSVTSTSEKWEVNADGYIVYRGAMQNLKVGNYDRLFAGRGYMEITFANGDTVTIYTPFDKKENVRSIRYVAQAFQADTSTPGEGEIRYYQLSETRKGIVNAYAAVDEIELMNYAAYAANNFLNVIAWNYPKLDESNGYNNATNIAIAEQMKATGIKVVNLTGKNLLVMTDQASIEKTRQIINFFWSQGLQTIAFAGNTSGMAQDKDGNVLDDFHNMPADFTQLDMPDFSDCEGFIGFMFWDEPTEEATVMTKLADLAIKFNNVYAGTNVTFMNNLLPSYASRFSQTSAYIAYVEEYCEKVLSKVKGEKWLSVDSYPVKADYSLDKAFLLDLGVLKTNAMEVGAHAHVALQSSGFENSQSSAKKRIPTEAEMRMQAYAAMAFGIDSISWFSYSPSGSDSETFYTFIDNAGNITDQTAYNAFAKVNNELAAIGAVYSAFTWKGIILGRGYNVLSDDYKAFTSVMDNIDSKYKLSASNTKHLSSITTNKVNYNYLMSVMQDASGNEGYVLCNYNALGKASGDKSQTITLTFKTNVTKVVIYRGGERSEVDTTTSGANKTLAISLATGEGVIVLPSKIG